MFVPNVTEKKEFAVAGAVVQEESNTKKVNMLMDGRRLKRDNVATAMDEVFSFVKPVMKLEKSTEELE